MQTSKAYKRKDPYGLLRFFMACMILLMHYNILMGNIKNLFHVKNIFLQNIIDNFMDVSIYLGGKVPICFFVLSGYLICWGYYEKLSTNNISVANFMKKRIIRLYPLLYISLVIMTISQWSYFFKYNNWWSGRNNDLSHFMIALTGIGVGTFFNIMDTVNGPIWYISVLMICYLIFSFISSRMARKRICFFIMVMIGYAIQYYNLNFPFFTKECSVGYIGFFTGVILFILSQNKYINRLMVKLSYFVILFMIVLCVLFQKRILVFLGDYFCWMDLVLFPSLIVLIENTHLRMFITNPFFSMLGKLSFPLYLLHMPIFCFSNAFLFCKDFENARCFGIIMCVLLVISIVWNLLEDNAIYYFDKLFSYLHKKIRGGVCNESNN